MRKKMLSTYDNTHSGEPYYPPLKRYESEIKILTRDEQIISSRELELLYQEAQECDFLMGKTPQVLPDHWEEED